MYAVSFAKSFQHLLNKSKWLLLVCGGIGFATTASALTPLGPGELFADLRATIGYDSNIFTNSAEEDDMIYTFAPSLQYVQDRGLLHLTAVASAAFNEYGDRSDQSGTDFVFGFDLSGMHRIPAPAVMFNLSGNFSDQRVASEEIATRLDVRQYGLDGSLDADMSDKTALRFSAGWQTREFDEAALSDSDDYNGRIDVLYKYSEKTNLKIGYRYRDIDHTSTGYQYDTVIAGMEGQLTRKVTGSLELGMYDGDTIDGSEFYYSIGVNWATDENTSFSLQGSRDATPSARGASAQQTRLNLSMSQRFTEMLSGTAMVGYGEFERDQGELGRSDDSLYAGVGLYMAVTEYGSVSAGLDYESRDSNWVESNYDRVLLRLTGSYRF